MPPMAIDAETRLFVRFRDDADLAALGELYDLTASELLRVAVHLVRDPARAEDLVQQTFLAAIEAAPRFDAARRVRAWLVGILTNLAHKLQRQEARVAELPAAAVADPVHLAAAAEFTSQVDDTIDTLPEVYQPVLVLHLKHGMVAAEIAHALRRPPGTVRTQLVRALELLKKALPASLAFSFGLLCMPLRGLAAVKATVMQSAAQQVAGTAAVAGAGTGMAMVSFGGTLLVKKYVAAVVLTLVALSLGSAWLLREQQAAPEAPVNATAAAARAALPTADASPAANTNGDAVVREAPPTVPTHGSLRYRFLWESDRTPAVGVFVHCVVWGRINAMAHVHNEPTDANGEIRITDLEPGGVGLYVDRNDGATLDITPGNESTGTYLIPRGIAVDVTVQDEEARPIPDARVWLSHYGNGNEGHEVGVTNGAGQFTIRDVGEARQVAARANGHAPSPSIRILAKPGERKAITLTLSRAAASLRGVVHNDDGQPCANAAVQVGFPYVVDPETHSSISVPPLQLRTDRDGRFTVDGAPIGELTIRARALGSGTARQIVHLARGESKEVDLRLPLAATVQGFVRDGDGKPLAKAHIGGGSTYGDINYCSTESAADGSFTVTELTPGRVELRAGCESHLPNTQALTLAAGERRQLDIVLQRSTNADQIRGELVDERGAPLANWIVNIPPPSDGNGWHAWLRTDKGGRFVATGCTRNECTLEIFAADTTQYVHALLVVPGVKRGEEPLRIVVPDTARLVGRLTGRIVGPDGRPLAEAHCNLRSPGVSHYQQLTTAVDGTFRAENLPARRYELDLEAKDHANFALPAIEIQPAKDLDLGTVVLSRGGRVTIEATGNAVEPKKWLYASICNPAGTSVAQIDLAAGTTSSPLAPGRYHVRLLGDGIAATSHECEVRDGETTTVRVALARGCYRSFTVHEPANAAWSKISLSACDERQQAVWSMDLPRRGSEPTSFTVCLGLGTWTLTARTDSGLTAEQTVAVSSLEAAAPIALELR